MNSGRVWAAIATPTISGQHGSKRANGCSGNFACTSKVAKISLTDFQDIWAWPCQNNNWVIK
jgi:hypothetical protein